MQSTSKREVLFRELPLIVNLSMAKNIFNNSRLNAKQLLHYGCIPALVYERVLAVLNPSMNKISTENE